VSASDNFSSWDTCKHYKLGTSCPVYALDSSRTTPLVEDASKQDVIHFSQFPMLRAGVSHQWGALLQRNELRCMIRYDVHFLGSEEGMYTRNPFAKQQGHTSIVSKKQGVHLIGS
jgi:hypothetical protein